MSISKYVPGVVRRFFKEKPWLLSSVWNLLHCPSAFFVKGGRFEGAFLRAVKFSIKGRDNHIICDKLSRLRNCSVVIAGNNNRIIINEHCYLSGLTLWIEGDNNEIVIGENTFIFGGELAALEGSHIEIGDDCLFSHSIEFRTSDSHKIYDENGIRINNAESIHIASHVWLGAHVKVLKGTSIAQGSVVGMGSIVTKNLTTPSAIYAGVPAKLIKERISWSK